MQIFGLGPEFGVPWLPGMELSAIADAAGAGHDVRRYLQLRGITSAGTLAMIAPDDARYRDIVVAPLLAGFSAGGERIALEDADKPIAAAILLFMRKLSIDANSPPAASPGPSLAASPPTTAASVSAGASKDNDRVPRTLPPGVWTAQTQKYEAVQIHGRSRTFHQQRLLGAESSLAKLWHQLKVTRDFAPLPLGEIMSRRSFDATGMVHALSKRKLAKELVVDVDRDRLVAEDADDAWEPRSAFILLEYGHEFDVNELFDDFIQKARQRPQQLDNFRSYYESASWKLCQELSAGRTFAEAVASVKEDLHMYQEIMSRPASPGNRATGSQRDPRKKRQHEESPCKDPPKKPRPTWDSKQKQWDDKQKATCRGIAECPASSLPHWLQEQAASSWWSPRGYMAEEQQATSSAPAGDQGVLCPPPPPPPLPPASARPWHPALRGCHRPRAPTQGLRQRRRCHLRSFTWTSSRA